MVLLGAVVELSDELTTVVLVGPGSVATGLEFCVVITVPVSGVAALPLVVLAVLNFVVLPVLSAVTSIVLYVSVVSDDGNGDGG